LFCPGVGARGGECDQLVVDVFDLFLVCSLEGEQEQNGEDDEFHYLRPSHQEFVDSATLGRVDPCPGHGFEPCDTGAIERIAELFAVVTEDEGDNRGRRFLVLAGEILFALVVSRRHVGRQDSEREDEEPEDGPHV